MLQDVPREALVDCDCKAGMMFRSTYEENEPGSYDQADAAFMLAHFTEMEASADTSFCRSSGYSNLKA